MPDSETIAEFLRRRKGEREDEASAVDWDDRRKEWLNDIEQLFSSIRAWLSEAEEEKLVTFQTGTVEIIEEYIGRYIAPTLTILLDNQSVVMTPAFRLTVGAQGRVDMVCGAQKVMIIRKRKNEWGIGIKKPGILDIADLDEESFAELLKALTN